MTKFLNISTDGTLSGNSDTTVVSEKAIKTYVDNHGGGGGSSTLAGLSDVILTSPTDGQVLTYDNGDWINADVTGGYHPDIFDWKWADHELNDIQWLRADTFSWQSGAVYQAAYQHLVDDITGKTATSETVGGVTISFYLADDGHKITTDESAVADIYTATGVAWYYVLDTVNQRFKLPRVNPDYEKLMTTAPVDVYGNGITVGWTQGSSYYGTSNYPDSTGLFLVPNYGAAINVSANTKSGPGSKTVGITPDATKSGITGTAKLTNATSYYKGKKHLYFYVGQFTQTALENTAGLNASLFNGKVDVGHEVIAFQAPTAGNNYTWCRKYADGWVEMGGQVDMGSVGGNTGTGQSVTLPVGMQDTYYTIQLTRKDGGSGFAQTEFNVDNITTSGFRALVWNNVSGTGYPGTVMWFVSGMAA